MTRNRFSLNEVCPCILVASPIVLPIHSFMYNIFFNIVSIILTNNLLICLIEHLVAGSQWSFGHIAILTAAISLVLPESWHLGTKTWQDSDSATSVAICSNW